MLVLLALQNFSSSSIKLVFDVSPLGGRIDVNSMYFKFSAAFESKPHGDRMPLSGFWLRCRSSELKRVAFSQKFVITDEPTYDLSHIRWDDYIGVQFDVFDHNRHTIPFDLYSHRPGEIEKTECSGKESSKFRVNLHNFIFILIRREQIGLRKLFLPHLSLSSFILHRFYHSIVQLSELHKHISASRFLKTPNVSMTFSPRE